MVTLLSLGRDRGVELVDFYGLSSGRPILWASLSDAEGRHTTICIDGRTDSPTRHRVFEGGRHPDSPNARLIELGSEEEGIAVSLLSTYLDSAEPLLTEYGRDLARETLLRYGEPVASSEANREDSA